MLLCTIRCGGRHVWDSGLQVQNCAGQLIITLLQPIPTKTLASRVQSDGSLSSFWRIPDHILSTKDVFRAFAPYFALFIIKQSSPSLRLTVCSQRFRISVFVAGGFPCITRSLRKRQIRCADSDITIRYRRVVPASVLPGSRPFFISPQAMISPMRGGAISLPVRSLHSSDTSSQTVPCPFSSH
jgi:hypothetical protein